jgi:hypothetical protein
MKPISKILTRAGALSGPAVLAIGMMAASHASAAVPTASPAGTIKAPCGQAFNLKVPAGKTHLAVVALGANGGGGGGAASSSSGGSGGAGSKVTASYAVKAGQVFHGVIGCGGQTAPSGGGVVGTGGLGGAGFEAGANGGDGWYCVGIPGACINGPDGSGGGGGGSTGLVKSTSLIPLVVAAGGGGGGESMCAGSSGGGGGGASYPNGGNGGQGANSGDQGGNGGISGSVALATPGATGNEVDGTAAGNGGGGAGYGGGSGGPSGNASDCSSGGGGGGGASYAHGKKSAVYASAPSGNSNNGSLTVTFS